MKGSNEGIMTTMCEPHTCPVETPAENLVVVCTGRKPTADNLVCRFSNGQSVPAHLDAETQQISCKPPHVRIACKVTSAIACFLSWPSLLPQSSETSMGSSVQGNIEHKSFKLFSGEEYIMDCHDGDNCKVMHR